MCLIEYFTDDSMKDIEKGTEDATATNVRRPNRKE